MFFGGGGGGQGGGQPNFFPFPGFGGGARPNGPPAAGGFNPLEMLFSGGFGPGGDGNIQLDPTLIDNLFGPGASAGFPMGMQQGPAPEEPRSSAPATAKSTMRQLPRIKVSQHDIEKNESNECSICLDELVLGQPALRIPCGHLYHEDCVNDWLKKSNECPVCRFELPTDDREYERGRQERMAGRKIRLRHEDLAARSCAELKRMAIFLKIDTKGCLEKCEFVERIAASDQVQILDPSDSTEALGSSSSSAMFDYAMAPGNSDMAEVLQAACAAGDSADSPEALGKRHRAECGDQSGSGPAPAAQPTPPLTSQSVGQLRQLAKQLGVSLDGCLEKEDMYQRIRAAPGYQES